MFDKVKEHVNPGDSGRQSRLRGDRIPVSSPDSRSRSWKRMFLSFFSFSMSVSHYTFSPPPSLRDLFVTRFPSSSSFPSGRWTMTGEVRRDAAIVTLLSPMPAVPDNYSQKDRLLMRMRYTRVQAVERRE